MTVVGCADNSRALAGFDKPVTESGISEIIAEVRYDGACLCAVGDGVIYVHFDGKTAINSVGQFGAGGNIRVLHRMSNENWDSPPLIDSPALKG